MQDPAIIRGLYAITPDRTDDDLLISQVEQVINGGVKLIQYRAKTIDKNQKKYCHNTAPFQAMAPN